MPNKVNTIIFDFDSTLSSIEGIDELARMTGQYEAVQQLTQEAMNGKVQFEDVFFKRLQLIKPTQAHLETLANLYQQHLLKDASLVIKQLIKKHIEVVIITGGYRQAILPAAKKLGIPEHNVWALELAPDEQGFLTILKPNHLQPTTTGKRDLVIQLGFTPKTIYVGDGATDLLVKPYVDAFIGFGGVAFRPAIKAQVDHYIDTPSLLPILDIINSLETRNSKTLS